MNSRFAQIESALAQRSTPLALFWRNDDVSTDEPRLRQLLTVFESHQVPISLAVIPGLLTESGIKLLQRKKTTSIELHQHGWQHVSHESIGKKCEFGASRAYDQQRGDIAAGQARMNEAFGSGWFPAFTPPWNRCTEITANVLADLGFRVLSRESSSAPLYQPHLSELPVTLDLFHWRGGATLRPSEELTVELVQQIKQAKRIGIMLHHQVMDEAAFALLDEWLRLFQQSPCVRFHTLQSLLESQ